VVQSTKLKFDADAGGLVSTVMPTPIAAPTTTVSIANLIFILFPLLMLRHELRPIEQPDYPVTLYGRTLPVSPHSE
jgi:hypothetical protein